MIPISFGPGILGAAAGLAIFSLLSLCVPPTPYEFRYGVFSPLAQWWANLALLPPQWISLLVSLPDNTVSIASGEGVPMVGRIVLALVLGTAPIIALFRLSSFSVREKALVAGHWILVAEVLFFWWFGVISDSNWRLCPVIMSSVAVTVCLVRNGLNDAKSFVRRLSFILLVFLIANGFLIHLQTSLLPCNWQVWRGKGTLIPLLEAIGIRDGYCTNFWFANATTAITANRFRLREVTLLKSGEWCGRQYLTDDRWFEPDPERSRTVFVCLPDEEPAAPSQPVNRFECEQFDFRNNRLVKLVVLVYDRDCLARNSELLNGL